MPPPKLNNIAKSRLIEIAEFSWFIIVPSISPKVNPQMASSVTIAVQSRKLKKEELSIPNIQKEVIDTIIG